MTVTMEAAGVCCGVQYLQGVRVLHFDQPQGWHLALDPLQATEYARDDWVSASPGELTELVRGIS